MSVTKNIEIGDETSLSVDLVDIYGISNDIHFLVTFDDGKFTWYEKETNKALTKVYPMHGNHPEIFVVQDRTYTIEFHHATESERIEVDIGFDSVLLCLSLSLCSKAWLSFRASGRQNRVSGHQNPLSRCQNRVPGHQNPLSRH